MLRVHLTPVKWLSSVTQTINAFEDMGEKENFCIIGGNEN
jgi:hypothetical protein